MTKVKIGGFFSLEKTDKDMTKNDFKDFILFHSLGKLLKMN